MCGTEEIARPAEIAGYRAPPSLGQERLYVMEQLHPGLSAYAMSYALRLEGPLDHALLHAAIQAVIARHDVLRTTFLNEAGDLSIFVQDRLTVELPLEDLSNLAAQVQPNAIQTRLERLTRAPFDLLRGPLLRFHLLRLAIDQHVLGLSIHHAICDGQSLRILRDELSTIYSGLLRSVPFALAELPIQFADFAEWERSTAMALHADHPALRYWRERLTDAPIVLALPTDVSRDALDGLNASDRHTGMTIRHDLPAETVRRLLALSRFRQATPAMAFASVLAALLARWSRHTDMVLALPVSKRNRAELTGMIGLLVDLLPLRIILDSAQSFTTLIDTVREAFLGAMRHQELPFERIVDAAQIRRSATTAPFQQVLFGFEEAEAPPISRDNEAAIAISEWDDAPEQDAKADLSFLIQMQGQHARIALRYSRQLFTQASATRLLTWFAFLCDSATDQPDCPISQLSLAPPQDTLALLRRSNDTSRPLPAPPTLAALFEAAVEAHADRPALTIFAEGADATRTIDYVSLNRRANRLAHYLSGHGVRRGDAVALAMPAGLDLITAILAVIKLGAHYVPLDPALPMARQAAMLDGAAVRTLLALEQTLPRLLTDHRLVVDVRRSQTEIARSEPANPPDAGTSASLAYVMFTSGSTGTPKGVAVPQRAVVRLVRNTDFLTIDPQDSVGFASNVSFDASTLEIWGALLNGARLLEVPKDILLSAAALARFILRHHLTVLWLTKGLFDQLVRSDPAVFRGLRVLLTGGDAASPTAFNAVLQASAGSGLTLLNGYGPTENTTFSTVWRAAGPLTEGQPVPIGRPIANSRAYILDEAQKPLPAGLVGELYVAGLGLADGYIADAALTAARFLPDPFVSYTGARMYRTGDLARQHDDGTIDYLGRIDDQVKIRGFRIELGEITTALGRHPSVAASHVTVQEDAEAGKRLVAYVVTRQAETVTVSDLRAHLAATLPDFMRPAAIMILPSLPLNGNGKIDRRALPLPGADATTEEMAFEPPRGASETALARIWADVLKRPDISRGANFFDLGGDSILTIRVAARAQDKGLPVTPKLLFQYQTVAGLAAAIEPLLAERGIAAGTHVLPLTGSQYRLAQMVLIARSDAAAPAPSGTAWVAGWAWSTTPIDAITFGLALRQLRTRHDALRLRLRGEARLRVLEMMDVPPPVPVSLHRLDPVLSPAATETACAAISETLAAGLDACHGTVFRGALIQKGSRGQYLLLLVHRLVGDEASVALLLEELAHSVTSEFLKDRPAEAPPSFRQWIERVAAYAARPDLTAQIAHWAQPAREAASLRAERNEPFGRTAPPREASLRLQESLSARLTHAALAARRLTSLDVALAALVAALEPYFGASDGTMLIDVVTDGRRATFADLDLSGMVGNVSRRFPVVVLTDDTASVFQRLAWAKSALRDLPDSGIGFELLDRDLRSLPFSRVVLVDGLAAGPVLDPTTLVQDLHVVGRPLAEAGSWILIRLERDRTGLAISCHIDTAQHPQGIDVAGLDDPHALAASMSMWLDRLLNPDAAQAVIYTPSDFPLAGLDHAKLQALLRNQDKIEDIYPLSPMQESLLIHALTASGNTIGFEQACHRIDGPLDVAAFQAAWQSAVDRHPILRTAFVWQGLDRPLQFVHAHLPFAARVDDWSHLSPAEQESHCAVLLAEDRRAGFRLDQPPLLRTTLVRLGPAAYIFVTSYHHILLDGWCLPQLEREVRLAYEAEIEGLTRVFRRDAPYRDYIAWLQRQDPAAAHAHFQTLLAGWAGPAPIPHDARTANSVVERAVGSVTRKTLALSEAEARSISRFARMERLTMGTMLHAAWALVLMQSTGQRDVVFGTTVSGRPPGLPGVESILGLFINNLPVRLTLSGDMPVIDTLTALQTQLLELRQYEATSPLEIETVGPEQSQGRMFDTLLVVENLPSSLHEWAASPNLRFTLLSSPLHTSYALTMVAIPSDGLHLSLLFENSQFASSTIDAMLREMRRLLLAMAEDRGLPMAALLRVDLVRPQATSGVTQVAERADPDRVLPRNTVELQVADIVGELLGQPAIGVTTDLVTLGMTSVIVSRLSLRLGRVFGRSIPLTAIIAHATVAQLAAFLTAGSRHTAAWQPLIPMGHGTPQRSFYCVHPIAGDVSVFFDLARAMTPRRRFVALQAPGLEPGDPMPESIEALAGLYVDPLMRDSPGPIDIGGYSFGGVVAFDIARQLETIGHPVRSVTIIDTPAPTADSPPDEEYSEAQWLWRMLRVRERFHAVDLALNRSDLECAEQDGHGYDLVVARLQEAGLLPETADADLLRRMAAVGRRHYRLYRAYRAIPITAPIAILRAAELNESEAQIDHSGRFTTADLGWTELTSGAVHTAVTPGDHVTMMRPPACRVLAKTIDDLLASIGPNANSSRDDRSASG